MRLLLTTDTVGGVWTFSSELTRELLRLDHSVALISFGRNPSAEQREWCSAIQSAYPSTFRYEASPAPLEWMANNQTAYAAGESLLLQVAAEFSPDLLHSSQFCFGRLPASFPRLITAHSDVLSWAAACRRGGLEASPWLTTYCGLVQEGLLAADAVVAPTRWMLDALGQNFELPASTAVILNGRTMEQDPGLLDPGVRAQPELAASLPRKLQAVSVGRLWDEAKNLAMLTGLNSPFPILIAGEQQLTAGGPSEDHGSASHVGPDSTTPIQALGFLDQQQLLTLFASSSLYIAASIYEPFGLAPLEAGLRGCAVVANDIPSLREVWGDAALYFNGPAALETLLQNLQSSPMRLAAAQAASQNRAKQLTAERMAAEYISVYRDLVGKQKPRAQAPIAQSLRELVTNAW